MYDSLADLGINTQDKNILLQVILHGTHYLHIADSLSQTIYTFLTNTNRFR